MQEMPAVQSAAVSVAVVDPGGGPRGPGPSFFHLARPSLIESIHRRYTMQLLDQQEVPGMEAPPQSSVCSSANSSLASAILPQNCTRNDLKRPNIQKFS